jgi:Protein of unknown function (DUF2764)
VSSYYFVGASLPALQFGEPPDIQFQEVVHLFKENLSSGDLEQVEVLRRLVDLYNLCAYIRDEPLDPHGNLSAADIEEARVTGVGIPEYSQLFFEKYEADEDRIRNLGELVAAFFNRELARASGFLHTYLKFEREWRLIMTAFRAKDLGRDVMVELQHEDPNDDVVAQIIAQKDAETFEPPNGYEPLKSIFLENEGKPRELHRALEFYRFTVLDEMMKDEVFSIGFLLGYTAQLMICERLREIEQ